MPNDHWAVYVDVWDCNCNVDGWVYHWVITTVAMLAFRLLCKTNRSKWLLSAKHPSLQATKISDSSKLQRVAANHCCLVTKMCVVRVLIATCKKSSSFRSFNEQSVAQPDLAHDVSWYHKQLPTQTWVLPRPSVRVHLVACNKLRWHGQVWRRWKRWQLQSTVALLV